MLYFCITVFTRYLHHTVKTACLAHTADEAVVTEEEPEPEKEDYKEYNAGYPLVPVLDTGYHNPSKDEEGNRKGKEAPGKYPNALSGGLSGRYILKFLAGIMHHS